MIDRVALIAALVVASFTPLHAETVAITDARIVSLGIAGDIRSGTVLVRDDRIVAIGSNVAVPAGAKVIDAKGMYLTPGLVLAPTPLALKDIIGNGGGRRSTGMGLSAAYEVAEDFNPRHPHVGEARIEGVTQALVTPDPQVQGKLFGGTSALVHLGQAGESILDPRAAIYLSATESGSREAGGGAGGFRVKLQRSLSDARDYQRNPKSFDLARLSDTGLSRSDLEALAPVILRQKPLLIEVNRAETIRHILRVAKEENIKVILSGASEAWLVADEIARAKIPVIIDGEMNQANGFEDINSTYENAAILTRAGVQIAFKPTFSRIGILDRSPRWTAGRAARYGLRLHDALAAITINPAKMLGVSADYGSIEVGKKADLVLWSGDPFETSTSAKLVMIDGIEQSLVARNRQLLDRYLPQVLPGKPSGGGQN